MCVIWFVVLGWLGVAMESSEVVGIRDFCSWSTIVMFYDSGASEKYSHLCVARVRFVRIGGSVRI